MNNDQPQLSLQATIVTKAQLNSIGISLPDDQMQALIQHVEETINERISEEVVESLSDDQLKELVELTHRLRKLMHGFASAFQNMMKLSRTMWRLFWVN